MTYTTTPVLLQTLAAVPTAAASSTAASTAASTPADATAAPTGEPVPAGAGRGLLPRAALALAVAAGLAAFLI